MNSFVLSAYASLAASRTFLQLLACLNFTLDSEDLFCLYKQKKWFLSTMAAAQAAENHGDEWYLQQSDIDNAQYIQQFQPEPTHKIH